MYSVIIAELKRQSRNNLAHRLTTTAEIQLSIKGLIIVGDGNTPNAAIQQLLTLINTFRDLKVLHLGLPKIQFHSFNRPTLGPHHEAPAFLSNPKTYDHRNPVQSDQTQTPSA
jgi:hypothetical protein